MIRRARKWLLRHVSFNSYLKIAKFIEVAEQRLDLAKYVFFTRTKEGNHLQGTINPKAHRATNNVVFKSVPYVAFLLIFLLMPPDLCQSIPSIGTIELDASTVSGFLTAILTIAGIFITLFYTNVPTVLSNKYPSSNGDIPRLFITLVLSDRDLNFCTSFVVVSALSFVACIVQVFSWPAFIYVVCLTMVLIAKLPSIFSLIAGKIDIAAVAAIPANRFLTLARASSFEKPFFDSDYLIPSFKRLARNELALLDTIMTYGLNAGDYSLAYSKAVNKITLETLAIYSRISVAIDTKSYWHAETSAHKTWFMSSTHELNLAIATGTIPQPKKEIDCHGYHKELSRISNKYGRFLIENDKPAEYINYFVMSTSVLECCINNGDIEWAEEYSKQLLDQCLEFCQTMNISSKEGLQTKCGLLELHAVMLLTIPLELGKLCDNVPRNAFHFDSFNTFSQAELQKQGFPLGGNAKMRALCKKLNYEKEVFGTTETPKWWFDKNVNSFGLEAIEQLCSLVLLHHSRYCSNVENLIESDPKSSCILALKEAELFSKTKHCIARLLALGRTAFGTEEPREDYLTQLDILHNSLVKTYPDLAKSFLNNRAELDDFFPDLYGFAFFNYCQLLLGDIINNRLTSFCESIMPLYNLTAISSLDLEKTVSEGSYNDTYKVQVLIEPTIFFLELCGMAYTMAELYEEDGSQEVIASHISAITKTNPKEIERWTICVALNDDVHFNGKLNMDLSSWRKEFLDAVENSGKYPDVPQYPFGSINRKPPAEKKRLLEMLPASALEFGDFSGCKVFNRYILEVDGHDQKIKQ